MILYGKNESSPLTLIALLFLKVTKLVKKVNCQYTFGVFTKWDDLKEKLEQQEGNATDIEEVLTDLRDKNKEKFLNSVNDRCTKNDIFFVDSQHVLKNPEASISPIVS